MFESFEIHSSQKNYSVHIGSGLLNRVYGESDDFVIVSDAALVRHWPELAHPRAIAIEARESAKTLETVATVIEQMRDLGVKRQSRMIAIGGGIVQDIATFCAASYMRGIGWSYYPTTLLGMVDSCIGGKSSINVGQYKNIAGNYFPPDEIVIDTNFCRSLQLTQKVAGLCEAVKICFAQRGPAFDEYLELASSPDNFDPIQTSRIIALSLRTKKAFIEEDEFDQGVRLLLNFGHTFGHALEGASDYSISHGVAVGLGMLAALHLSRNIGLNDGGVRRAEALADYVRSLVRQVPQLALTLERVSMSEAFTKFKSDKKHRKTEYAVILIDQDGHLVRHFIPMSRENDALIMSAFEAIKREVNEIQSSDRRLAG